MLALFGEGSFAFVVANVLVAVVFGFTTFRLALDGKQMQFVTLNLVGCTLIMLYGLFGLALWVAAWAVVFVTALVWRITQRIFSLS